MSFSTNETVIKFRHNEIDWVTSSQELKTQLINRSLYYTELKLLFIAVLRHATPKLFPRKTEKFNKGRQLMPCPK